MALSRDHIPVYEPYLDKGNEAKYVLDCLDSSWISSRGKYCDSFEKSFQAFLKSRNATSVANGTVALHLALLTLNIGPGDEVIVPSFTYIATVNAIKYVGAIPIFVDVSADTWNINFQHIEKLITINTKAIICVHIYGNPCNMDELCGICLNHKLFLIEDCAESLGTFYKQQHVGTFGDIGTFSFFGNKTITTGEGGMITAKKNLHIKTVNLLKNQAVSSKREYWHEKVGYNYRLTNLASAIGLAQMEKLNFILERKKEIASIYKKFLNGLPIKFQETPRYGVHSYWMVAITFEGKKTCNSVRNRLKELNIETKPLFQSVNRMPPYKTKKCFYESNKLSQTGICLPSFPGLLNSDLKIICKEIEILMQLKT